MLEVTSVLGVHGMECWRRRRRPVGEGMRKMEQRVEAVSRDAALVEDAHIRSMMGFEILEPLPTRSVPYERLDPFILVHESRFRLSELADVDTKHPHRG